MNWKSWFAWYPVRTIEGKYVWLKTVWHRKIFIGTHYVDKEPKVIDIRN